MNMTTYIVWHCDFGGGCPIEADTPGRAKAKLWRDIADISERELFLGLRCRKATDKDFQFIDAGGIDVGPGYFFGQIGEV